MGHGSRILWIVWTSYASRIRQVMDHVFKSWITESSSSGSRIPKSWITDMVDCMYKMLDKGHDNEEDTPGQGRHQESEGHGQESHH